MSPSKNKLTPNEWEELDKMYAAVRFVQEELSESICHTLHTGKKLCGMVANNVFNINKVKGIKDD